MAEQVWWEGERWKLLKLAWLASLAFALSRLRLGQTKLRWHERLLGAVARAQQLEGRRGQAWTCLHVMRSSEHECGEFRQARTGLQECDGCIQLIPISHFALCDDRVVQHRAAVLSSGMK